MDYSQAKRIRQKGFLNLFEENLVQRQQGVFKSLRQTISERSSARWTGIKETFDPMNVVRFAFGGSNLAAAMYGRMMGRSQSDISYFARNKKAAAAPYTPKQTASKIQPLPSQSSFGESGVKMLNDIYRVMVKSHETDVQFRETERSFREERENEEQRRHEQLVKAIRQYGSVGPTKTGSTDISGNIFSSLLGLMGQFKKMLENTIDFAKKMFEALGGWNTIKNILGLMTNPFTVALLAGGAASWFAATVASDPNFRKAFRDNNYMLNAQAGDAAIAANILDVSAKDAREKKLVDNANSTKESLIADMPWYKRGSGYGVREHLIKEKGLTREEADFLMPAEQLNEEKFGDITEREKMLANIQKKMFGVEGARSMREAKNAPKPPPTLASESNNTALNLVPSATTSTPSVKQIPTPPDIGRIIDENNNLKMEDEMKVIEPPPPIVNTSSNSNSVEDRPIGVTASQRDDVAILNRVLDQSRALI